MMRNKLPITEELDFAYLLELMLPLHNVPEFAWLPELFSIVGHDSLINLCKYAGGETITIPTTEQLSNSINALQWFYDIEFNHTHTYGEVPKDLCELVQKIHEVYYARDCETEN